MTKRKNPALSAWENEGGAIGSDPSARQYGRRIEADRSWTVYHVFTGTTASVDGHPMTGLNRASATRSMLALNLNSRILRRERIALHAGSDPAKEGERPS